MAAEPFVATTVPGLCQRLGNGVFRPKCHEIRHARLEPVRQVALLNSDVSFRVKYFKRHQWTSIKVAGTLRVPSAARCAADFLNALSAHNATRQATARGACLLLIAPREYCSENTRHEALRGKPIERRARLRFPCNAPPFHHCSCAPGRIASERLP